MIAWTEGGVHLFVQNEIVQLEKFRQQKEKKKMFLILYICTISATINGKNKLVNFSSYQVMQVFTYFG